MSTKLRNDKIIIHRGRIQFIPSGSSTINPYIAESFSSSSYEVTCSANTDGHLAPTNSSGSFLLFSDTNGQRLAVLYTTGSNPSVSSSIFTPTRIRTLRGKHVTASINLGDTANDVALATFTALSASMSDKVTRLGSAPFNISRTGSAVTVTCRTPGKTLPARFNAQLTSSYGFVIHSITGSGNHSAKSDAPGHPDVDQASINIELVGTRKRDLAISSSKGQLLFVSESGRIGIGTTDPKQPFDVRTTENTADGTKLILRSGRGNNAVQQGDSAGEIDFVIESGSFNDIETSGSLAKIRADVESIGTSGATGRVVLAVAKDTTNPAIDIIDWRYNGVSDSGFFQEMSASILIKDFSNSIRSKLEFQKSSNSFPYMSLQTGSMYGTGNIEMDGTGSFGLIEGGTF
jgi:hypothetical protein